MNKAYKDPYSVDDLGDENPGDPVVDDVPIGGVDDDTGLSDFDFDIPKKLEEEDDLDANEEEDKKD